MLSDVQLLAARGQPVTLQQQETPCAAHAGKPPSNTTFHSPKTTHSHFENNQRAAELHDTAAHFHGVTGQQGKQDHLNRTRAAPASLAYSRDPYQHIQGAATGQGIAASGHADIAALTYLLWEAGGQRFYHGSIAAFDTGTRSG
jgi:hypothetical protein